MKRRAFSLIEVLIALVIIAILIAILFPVVTNARRAGEKTTCISNLRQIGQAAIQYAGDNDDHVAFNVFGGNEWLKRLGLTTTTKYGNRSKVTCPALQLPPDYLPETTGYAFNTCTPTKLPPEPSKTVMAGEVGVYYPVTQPNQYISADFLYFPDSYLVDLNPWVVDSFGSRYLPYQEWGAKRHEEKANYVFFDGSVKTLAPNAFRIPLRGHPCEKKVDGWMGPAGGPVFNPAGSS